METRCIVVIGVLDCARVLVTGRYGVGKSFSALAFFANSHWQQNAQTVNCLFGFDRRNTSTVSGISVFFYKGVGLVLQCCHLPGSL